MRYQSTPEKEFDGDIIITDPCYIIRNENGITKNDWYYCEYGESRCQYVCAEQLRI